MDLDTELTPVGDGKTLDLHYGDRGSVHIGTVTGIDARGLRADGTVRLVDGQLELGLPAEFVESAALPLVLDPTLGSAIQISNDLTVADEQDPDIAYDRTTDDYLCVWERRFSASDYDIVAQRFSSSGTKVGSPLLLETDGLVFAYDPCVANQNANNMFVVVWVQSGDIYGRSVRATDGATGPIAGVIVGADSYLDPAMASESAFSADDDVLLVYENTTQTTIEARTIHANETSLSLSFPLPGIVTLQPAAAGWDDYDPEISSHGGEEGTFLVVWRRYFSSAATSQIRGMIIDRQLNSITPTFITITSTSTSEYSPSCDGDGKQWVVAFERYETGSTTDKDIFAVSIVRDSSTGVTISGEANASVTQSDNEYGARVAWLGESVLVTWCDETTSTDYDIYGTSLDPFNCSVCESSNFVVSVDPLFEAYVAVASRFSGGAAAAGGSFLHDDCFVVWEARDTTTNNSEIRGLRYTAYDGYVYDQGGACGQGGEAFATCTNVPHSGFEFRLVRAEPSRASWLIMSPGRAHFTCGPCALVADPFYGIVVPNNSTDASGSNSLPVAIPSSSALIGVQLYTQWLVAATTPTCALPPVDMSNALLITLQ